MALGKQVVPAKREALCPQCSYSGLDRDFELLLEDSCGHRASMDTTFKAVLKKDLLVQDLLLKWKEKVTPSKDDYRRDNWGRCMAWGGGGGVGIYHLIEKKVPCLSQETNY